MRQGNHNDVDTSRHPKWPRNNYFTKEVACCWASLVLLDRLSRTSDALFSKEESDDCSSWTPRTGGRNEMSAFPQVGWRKPGRAVSAENTVYFNFCTTSSEEPIISDSGSYTWMQTCSFFLHISADFSFSDMSWRRQDEQRERRHHTQRKSGSQ